MAAGTSQAPGIGAVRGAIHFKFNVCFWNTSRDFGVHRAGGCAIELGLGN